MVIQMGIVAANGKRAPDRLQGISCTNSNRKPAASIHDECLAQLQPELTIGGRLLDHQAVLKKHFHLLDRSNRCNLNFAAKIMRALGQTELIARLIAFHVEKNERTGGYENSAQARER